LNRRFAAGETCLIDSGRIAIHSDTTPGNSGLGFDAHLVISGGSNALLAAENDA